MLEGKTQTPLEWPQSVALAAVGFEKKICILKSDSRQKQKDRQSPDRATR